MKVLIIIPAYNEAENIQNVVQSLNHQSTIADYIVVNDCSTDATKEILHKIGANYLNLPVNLGIGGGVQTGYLYAKENNYDIAIQMDGDGQHDPKYIMDLIMPIKEGNADVVIGSRFIKKEGFQSSVLRRFGIKFLSIIIKACTGTMVYDVTSGFRAVNRKMIEVFAKDYAQDYPEPEAIVTSVLSRARICEIPVIMNERAGGKSSINSYGSIYYMIKVTIAIIIHRFTFDAERK